MAACVQTSYGTVPMAMARSYSAAASAHRPARPRSSARRVMNGMSAPARSPRQVRLAFIAAAERGEGLGAEPHGQCQSPGREAMTRSSSRRASSRSAVGERVGGPMPSQSADDVRADPARRPGRDRRRPRSASPSTAGPGHGGRGAVRRRAGSAISRSRCQRAANPSPIASASRAQASCQPRPRPVGRRRLADRVAARRQPSGSRTATSRVSSSSMPVRVSTRSISRSTGSTGVAPGPRSARARERRPRSGCGRRGRTPPPRTGPRSVRVGPMGRPSPRPRGGPSRRCSRWRRSSRLG